MTAESKRGSNGGNARAEKLTKEQRSEIAKAAAAKRWGKKEEKPLLDPEYTKIVDHIATGIKKSLDGILQENGLLSEGEVLHGDIYPTYGGIERGSIPIVMPNVTSPIQATPEPPPQPPAPVPTVTPTPASVAPPKPARRQAKPIPKAFKGASSYAGKRLAEAIRERAEAMGKVAMLNAEIPSLVQIIRALGMTPNMEGFQDFTAQMPSMYPQPINGMTPNSFAPPSDPYSNAPNPIDPALYATNAAPVTGLAPAVQHAPLIPNTSLGGAVDLGYVPEEEEGPPLPSMGGGWH
jgi:hypothetical protein